MIMIETSLMDSVVLSAKLADAALSHARDVKFVEDYNFVVSGVGGISEVLAAAQKYFDDAFVAHEAWKKCIGEKCDAALMLRALKLDAAAHRARVKYIKLLMVV